jgi:alpha-ketoglutarate-dependent taurine dioxygenase
MRYCAEPADVVFFVQITKLSSQEAAVATSAHPITSTVGLEITGFTVDDLLRRDSAAEIREALDRYGVLVYREVHIGDDDLLALSRTLGTVVVQPTGEHRLPEIQTITLDPSKTNAMLASFRQGNFHWHIDGATQEVPQKATLLTALQVDPAGGDTEFASTYAAYEELPEQEKAELEGLEVIHTFAHAQSLANPNASEAEQQAWKQVPAQVHPLIWSRKSGRKSLLLGATASEVVGWPVERGRALLDRLLEWTTQPRFVLRQSWRRGDLVIWDNTGMLHRALPFEPTSVRLMHRTTLAGEDAVTAN